MCVPGVPGHTENLRVRSIVGGIWSTRASTPLVRGKNLRIYIASGDFLTRNTERRVEVGIRIEDRSLKEKLWGFCNCSWPIT